MLLRSGADHCRLLHIPPANSSSLKPVHSAQTGAILLPTVDQPQLLPKSNHIAKPVRRLAITECKSGHVDSIIRADNCRGLLDGASETPHESPAPVLGHRLGAQLEVPSTSNWPLLGDEKHGVWLHVLKHVIECFPELLQLDVIQAPAGGAELYRGLKVRAGLACAGRANGVAGLQQYLVPVLETMALNVTRNLDVKAAGPVVYELHGEFHFYLLGPLLSDEILTDTQIGDSVRIHLGPTTPYFERVTLGAAKLLNPLWNLRQRGSLPQAVLAHPLGSQRRRCSTGDTEGSG